MEMEKNEIVAKSRITYKRKTKGKSARKYRNNEYDWRFVKQFSENAGPSLSQLTKDMKGFRIAFCEAGCDIPKSLGSEGRNGSMATAYVGRRRTPHMVLKDLLIARCKNLGAYAMGGETYKFDFSHICEEIFPSVMMFISAASCSIEEGLVDQCRSALRSLGVRGLNEDVSVNHDDQLEVENEADDKRKSSSKVRKRKPTIGTAAPPKKPLAPPPPPSSTSVPCQESQNISTMKQPPMTLPFYPAMYFHPAMSSHPSMCFPFNLMPQQKRLKVLAPRPVPIPVRT